VEVTDNTGERDVRVAPPSYLDSGNPAKIAMWTPKEEPDQLVLESASFFEIRQRTTG
jgi:hypothetical protein